MMKYGTVVGILLILLLFVARVQSEQKHWIWGSSLSRFLLQQQQDEGNHEISNCNKHERLNPWRRRSLLNFGLPAVNVRFRGGGTGAAGADIVENSNEINEKQNNNGDKNNNKEREEEEEEDEESKSRFSLYQLNDGSHDDKDHIPRRFLNMQKGDRTAAKAALDATLGWRSQHQVDTILQRPHPLFDICKSITYHTFLGRDTTNHVVFFQRPAINSQQHLQLAQRNNITNNDLILHYVYVLEYCWNILDPPTTSTSTSSSQNNNNNNKDNVMTSIIDLTGLDFSLLKQKELIGFVQQFVTMMSNHYPQRSYKTLIINAPSWFGLLYKLIKPLLRQSTKQKIQILSRNSKKQLAVLKKILGEECIQYLPPDLFVSSVVATNNKIAEEEENDEHNNDDDDDVEQSSVLPPSSPMENELRQFCCDRLQEAGMEMKKSI